MKKEKTIQVETAMRIIALKRGGIGYIGPTKI
jgi:hypothetical protein